MECTGRRHAHTSTACSRAHRRYRADVDEATREIILTIHCEGGQHSRLRIRRPRTGEHGCSTSDEALAVIRSMVTRWSDQDIAASLNRMGILTGQGKTWTAHRVSSVRHVRDIHAYKSADKDGEWLTMSEAAKELGVTHYMIRRLINDRIVPAEQSCLMPHGRFARSICTAKRLPQHWRASIARVATMSKGRSQSLSRFQKEVHDERPIATPRSARSTGRLSISSWPSSQ